ncbi:hypothetical protein Nepgr_009352 [Nepenthes gracilis]|uniref:Uncharacterized protein n=1 Tax=Nepenthes gracilis TaxID=150966 RepID=A0AAD3XK31_NEPGR|nr:hypothetical protein Nepgr_009352 [Nepenthes gracilis]
MRNPSSSSSGVATTKTPCCSKIGLKRGPWTPEEDELLANYIKREGEGRWRTLPKRAGLLRCGKSCRLRWMNYLRPSVKRGQIAPDEEDLILRLHRLLGNRWSLIAGRIPGRTDNEIKNYWNTHLSKKLISQGIDPRTHKAFSDHDKPNKSNKSSPSKQSPINNIPVFPKPKPNLASTCNKSASEESNANANSGTSCAAQKTVFVNKAAAAYGNFDGCNYAQYHDGIVTVSNGCDNNVNFRGLDHHGSGMDLTVRNNIEGNELSPSLEEDEEISQCTDDVISSFLNSLINEDMFTAQNQMVQQQQLSSGNITAPCPEALISSSTQTVFGFGADWEAPLMSRVPVHNQNDHFKRFNDNVA